MASASDYLENKLVDYIFRAGTFTAPSSIYVALCTAATTDADTGSTITEVSGGSYARTALNPSGSNWANTQASGTGASTGTGGVTSNSSTITFPTATGSWGTITHIALVDASSAGNVLFHGALTASKTVGSGDVLSFNAGSLSITVG